MLIYLEKKAKEEKLTHSILEKFQNAQILEIDHYKNIFDKFTGTQKLAPAIIIAKQEHPKLLPVPPNYGYPNKAFFFKTSLNCIFDCEYCYLKGSFKTPYPVIFVNYESIQEAIKEKIEEERKKGYQGMLTFYASNYSDIQGLDPISQFNLHFIPFFEQFDKVLMETRTKSAKIDSFLEAYQGKIPHNTEIAFSLNPETIIEKYEKGAAPLSARIEAINSLLQQGYKVGLRFLPLLAIKDYEKIYTDFLLKLQQEIPIDKIHSIFIASLIYNR